MDWIASLGDFWLETLAWVTGLAFAFGILAHLMPCNRGMHWWKDLRGAAILRLAMLEGCALFGVVICLLGVVLEAATQHPWIWANAASAALFLIFAVLTFPTAERLASELTGRRL